MAGREIILLASNNYLGVSTEPTVVKAAQDALDEATDRGLEAAEAGAHALALLLCVGAVVGLVFAAPGDGHLAAAEPTVEQAGQQILAPAERLSDGQVVAVSAAHLRAALCLAFLSRLHRVPEFLVDNPQLRHLDDLPFTLGVQRRALLFGQRVFPVAETIPDASPDIELVVQDTGAA